MPSEEFEEWWEGLEPESNMVQDYVKGWASAAWDASRTQTLFEANSKLGDEGNEGMKHERMVKAAAAISILYPDRTADWDKLRAIIEEAQG